MNVRHLLLASAVFALSGTAAAHDPSPHEPAAHKPKPTACEHLAQPAKYDINLADATTKSLKATCDAKKQNAAKK